MLYFYALVKVIRLCIEKLTLLYDPFRYSIEDPHCPVTVDPVLGHLSLKRQLDREQESSYTFQVIAEEDVINGMMYIQYIKINVVFTVTVLQFYVCLIMLN